MDKAKRTSSRIWIASAGIGLLLTAQAIAAEKPAFKNEQEKESYAVGVDLARNLKRQGVVAQANMLAKGVQDELSNAKLLLSEEELRASLIAFQTKAKERLAEAKQSPAEQNRLAGEAFLAANKAKEGVVTLVSGLQYKILREGTGRKPTDADTVECRFRGTFIDGQEFNGSDRTGKPAIWKLKDMPVAGVREALMLMPVGSQWQLFVPPQLAYGEKGIGSSRRTGQIIGPNETLVFEIELLAIK